MTLKELIDSFGFAGLGLGWVGWGGLGIGVGCGPLGPACSRFPQSASPVMSARPRGRPGRAIGYSPKNCSCS